jgi:prephenate dehydratase
MIIMQNRKDIEIIGVSGAPGSFSEEAGRTYTEKTAFKEATFNYLITVENVLSALEVGEITLGIFPIMNSIGGLVVETAYAVGKHRFETESIFDIEIHQNLLVKKGSTPDSIIRVLSHDQAVKQCRGYLARVWPGVEIGEYPDTAQAAADLASGILPASTAVIASRAAAERYGLDILGASIQDLKNNLTTFIAARQFSVE